MDASNAQHTTAMNTVTGKHETVQANDPKAMRRKQVCHGNVQLARTHPEFRSQVFSTSKNCTYYLSLPVQRQLAI